MTATKANHTTDPSTAPAVPIDNDQQDAVPDPVCGMTVNLRAQKPTHEHEGKMFHFCSQNCQKKFSADPEFYLSGAHKRKPKSAAMGAVNTCPMHPDVIDDHASDCPHCGMALSPMVAAAAISLSSVSIISNALWLRNVRL